MPDLNEIRLDMDDIRTQLGQMVLDNMLASKRLAAAVTAGNGHAATADELAARRSAKPEGGVTA